MATNAMNMTLEQAEAAFRAGSPRSLEEFERGRTVMPGVAKGAYFYGPYPLAMERGEGCYLFDLDERRFVDFAGHHTAQILGHGRSEEHTSELQSRVDISYAVFCLKKNKT